MDAKRLAIFILQSIIINNSRLLITNLEAQDILYIIPTYYEIQKQEKEFVIDYELESLVDDIMNKNIIVNEKSLVRETSDDMINMYYNILYNKVNRGNLIVIHKFIHQYIVNHINKNTFPESVVIRIRTLHSKVLYQDLLQLGIDLDINEELIFDPIN